MHLLTSNQNQILLDCGMFQGKRKESDQKNRSLPITASDITNIVLSHGHIDHSGRIPYLVRKGFGGRIICTRATAAACEFLLLDSAHIQESDAAYLNYKLVRNHLYDAQKGKKGRNVKNSEKRKIKKKLKSNHRLNVEAINELIETQQLEGIQPLYSSEDAEAAISQFDGVPYRHPVTIGDGITCTLYDAGHILGSAFSIITVKENGKTLKIGYTGDIGRFDKPIIKDPCLTFDEADRNLDLLIMESTYGDRHHEPVVDLKPRLKKVIKETQARGGAIMIPSFAFGRTQELLYVLHELYDEQAVPKLPVYVDSPLATRLTKVFGEHPEVYDAETHDTFLEEGKNPFAFERMKFVRSVEESMALNRDETPHIVISASGMCEAGRILHHLRHKIHNSRHTILIVGYMAANTLGRRLQDKGEAYAKAGRKGPPPRVKFMNKEYPLAAHVLKLGGFSAHADQAEMLRVLKTSNLNIKRVALVHGEEDQSLKLAKVLEKEGFEVTVPYPGDTLEIA
jgi:metallo-beta-lactamase family protein